MSDAARLETAVSDLAAYDRACRAALVAGAPAGAPLAAPAAQLSEAALAALFTPASYESLVERYLIYKKLQCGATVQTEGR